MPTIPGLINQTYQQSIFSTKMTSNHDSPTTEPTQGRWTEEQHHRFLAGLIANGKDWKIIQKIVRTRTDSQVRSHAQKFFIKLHKAIKDRKKHASAELQQIEKQIVQNFNEPDLTPKSPTEIITLLRLQTPEKIVRRENKKEQQKQKVAFKEPSQKQKSKQIADEMKATYEDSSYLAQIIKINNKYFENELVCGDFINFCQVQQKMSPKHKNPYKPQHSFCLPNDEENQTKLQQALSSLRNLVDSNASETS